VARASSGDCGAAGGKPTLACEPRTEITRPNSSAFGIETGAAWGLPIGKIISAHAAQIFGD
jgi:hypothetical protein